MSAREPARCAAPIYLHASGCACHATPGWAYGDPCQAWDVPRAHEGTCGDDAATTRTVEGIVVHLCEEHARELDADAAEEPADPFASGGWHWSDVARVRDVADLGRAQGQGDSQLVGVDPEDVARYARAFLARLGDAEVGAPPDGVCPGWPRETEESVVSAAAGEA